MNNVNGGIKSVGQPGSTYTTDWKAQRKAEAKAWHKMYSAAFEAGDLPDNDPYFGTAQQVKCLQTCAFVLSCCHCASL